MTEDILMLTYLTRGARNTAEQINAFTIWLAKGGAPRRERWLAMTRSMRACRETPFATDLPTSPIRTHQHQTPTLKTP